MSTLHEDNRKFKFHKTSTNTGLTTIIGCSVQSNLTQPCATSAVVEFHFPHAHVRSQVAQLVYQVLFSSLP